MSVSAKRVHTNRTKLHTFIRNEQRFPLLSETNNAFSIFMMLSEIKSTLATRSKISFSVLTSASFLFLATCITKQEIRHGHWRFHNLECYEDQLSAAFWFWLKHLFWSPQFAWICCLFYSWLGLWLISLNCWPQYFWTKPIPSTPPRA